MTRPRPPSPFRDEDFRGSHVAPDKRPEYYRCVADLTRIAWEAHQADIRTGQASHAVAHAQHPALGGRPERPFRFPQDISRERPLGSLIDAVTLGTTQYLRQLLPNNAEVALPGTLLVRSAYTDALANRAYELIWNDPLAATRNQTRKPSWHLVYGSLHGGMYTGVRFAVAAALTDVFGPNPERGVLQHSRIGIAAMDSLNDCMEFPDSGELLPLRAATRAELRLFGFGEAVGCPASHPATPETCAYLAERGLPHEGTLIASMVGVIRDYVAAEVQPRLGQLTRKTRRAFWQPLPLRTAEKPKAISAPSCPYHG